MAKRGKIKIPELIKEKGIKYVVGIDESGNSGGKEKLLLVGWFAKLNKDNQDLILQKQIMHKTRPNRNYKQEYKEFMAKVSSDPLYSWFYFCNLIDLNEFNHVEKILLTQTSMIEYIGENFLPLEKTLFLIDGLKMLTRRGIGIEGLLDPLKKEDINIINIGKGDEKLPVIGNADTIAYALYHDRKFKDSFKDRRIDVQSYSEKLCPRWYKWIEKK